MSDYSVKYKSNRRKSMQWIVHACLLVSNLVLHHSCITFSSYDKGKLIVTADTIAEIPVVIESGLLILEAEINGVKGKFLFDNGFSLSALDTEFAEAANISFKGSSRLTDFNKRSVKTPKTTIDTARISHFIFIGTDFHEINTAHIFPCLDVNGIIGASIINKTNWEIDFIAKKIRISRTPFKNEGVTLDISYRSNNSARTTLWLNGDHPVRCNIDFGSNSSLSLNYDDVIPFLRDLEVEKNVGIKSISTHGPGPEETFYTLSKPISVRHKNSVLLPTTATISHNLKYSGNIGSDFFKNYLVTINSKKKEYILSPQVSPEMEYNHADYGITIYHHEGLWQVFHKNVVDPKFEEVEILDTVTKIDHLQAGHFKNICDYRSYMKAKKERQEPLVLKLQGLNKSLIIPFEQPETIPLK